MRPPCTCAGTAPGYPQHESYCGQDERDDGSDVLLECQGCGNVVPFDLAVFEYADRGTWWEQSWPYHPACFKGSADEG